MNAIAHQHQPNNQFFVPAHEMSYRELRNITEYTRALGYPRLLSIDNFRVPNFKLVAELLEWIVKRFEPNALISSQCETESERVLLVKSAVLLLLQNARLKLNPKKLYMADGHAVQELLIPLKVLYTARTQTVQEEGGAANWNALRAKINAKMQDVRIARQLSSQLPQTGAVLHDLLGKELYFRNQRNRATSRAIPLQDAERSFQQAVTAVGQESKEITEKLNNIVSDENALDEKIERKKREYEQLQKRYAKLQSFRPQYMDEYEKYEAKLKQLYEIYVLKFRNLAYLQLLQVEMERADRQKQAETERNMRQVVEKMRSEQKELAPPIDIGDMDDEPEMDKAPAAPRKIFGSMTGAGLSDDEDEEDEDGDDLILHSDDDERMMEDEVHELDDDEERRLSSGDDF